MYTVSIYIHINVHPIRTKVCAYLQQAQSEFFITMR
jgi:hypothetical protein